MKSGLKRTDEKKTPSHKAGGLLHHIFTSLIYIGHKSNVTGSLHCKGDGSLMSGTVACDPAGEDLSSLGDISLELVYILVADAAFFCISAEYTDLFTPAHAAHTSFHRGIALVCL